jgi:hypothetical protein
MTGGPDGLACRRGERPTERGGGAMMSRPILVAAAAAVLSPATAAGLELACDYVAIRPLLPPDLWTSLVRGVFSRFTSSARCRPRFLGPRIPNISRVLGPRLFGSCASSRRCGSRCGVLSVRRQHPGWPLATVAIGAYCDAERRCVGSTRQLLRLARSRHGSAAVKRVENVNALHG